MAFILKTTELKMESVSRKRGYQQLFRPRLQTVIIPPVDILRLHTSHDIPCDRKGQNKMVELQKTFSFDEHILPRLLREREKYSGRLPEEGYGIVASIENCLEIVYGRRTVVDM